MWHFLAVHRPYLTGHSNLPKSFGYILYFRNVRIGPYLRSSSNAAFISKLRKETSLSLLQCKKALEEHQYDYEKALQWLYDHGRQMGEAKAETLKTRTIKEGWISIYPIDNGLLLTELNCETDFVARNELFHRLILHIQEQAVQHGLFSVGDLVAHPYIRQNLHETIARLGENIQLRRTHFLRKHLPDDTLGYFVHGSQPPHFESGRIAAMISAPSSVSPLFAKQLAQHIVGMNPSSKEEWMDQSFLFDPSKSIAEILGSSSQSIDFIRAECGGPYLCTFNRAF
jgi:translation elongation factor EF-Ts